MQKVRNRQKGMIAGARVLGASLILSTSLLAPIATVYAETGEGRVPNVTLPNGVPTNYDLTWFDEFDGDKLDRTKWDYSLSSFDPKNRTQMHFTDDPANVSLKDGILHLTALYTPKQWKWNDQTKKHEWVDRENTYVDSKTKQTITYKAPFTSGAIQTRDRHGKVLTEFVGDFYAESRIKLPFSESSWASFWMTGTKGGGSPTSGEIDVFESKGYDPKFIQANIHTAPTPEPGKEKYSDQYQKKLPNNGDTQTAFHTYGVLKEGDKITFFYDGQALYTVKYSEIKKNEAFVNPENGFILRLTHIVGGSFVKDFGKNATRNYTDAIPYKDSYKDGSRSDMQIDYVRVWQPSAKPVTTEAPTTTTTTTTAATTEAPVVTTSAPVVTEAPVVTTSAPVVTEAPVVTTSAPVATEAPVVTTSAPVATEAPVVTTLAPVATEAPVVTTSAPVVTEAPVVTTSAPVATEAPVVTTSAPVVTEAPVVTTSAPVATEAPVVTTSAPVATEAPVVTTSAPVVTEAPVVTTVAPTTTTTTTEAPTTTTATTVTEEPTTTTVATTELPTPTPEAEVSETVATSEAPAPVAVLTNAVEDKVVTAETNTEATESRVLATPLAAKAEQAADKEAKDAKDPSSASVAQAAPAGEDELPNTGTSMGTLYLILSAVFLTGGAFVFAKSKK